MPNFVFESARLRARHLEPGDVDALLDVYGDPEVVRWVADGKPLDRARCEDWLRITQRNYATRGYGMVALVERESEQVVGFCGLVHPAGQPQAEIKYALRRSHWGGGLATEAAIALLAYGRSRFGISKVVATTDPANVASHRVLLKAGLQRAELRRNEDGTFTQVFVWGGDAGQTDVAP
jgi:RimJ/RimL family protein N-acetyltransferase